MSTIVRRFASTSTRLSLAPNIRQLLANSTPSDTEQTTTVSGWIKSIRKQKNMSFAVVTDGSSPKGLQAVLVKGKEDEILRRYLSALCIPLCSHMNGRLTNGAAVRLTGRLVSSPGEGQSHELLVDDKAGGQVEVLGDCDPEVSTKFQRCWIHSNVASRLIQYKRSRSHRNTYVTISI